MTAPGLRVDLRHLRVLLEIERSGSIRRAAAVLRIAQPALTAQVRRIEQALGGPVFTRTGRGIQLTELGRYVLGASREIVDAFDGLLTETAALADRTADIRPVRVAAMPELDVHTMLTALTALLPGAVIATRQLATLTAGIDMLAGDDADLALLYDFPGTPIVLPERVGRIDVVPVEPALLALPRRHPLAALDEVPLAALADEPWIVGDDPDASGRRLLFHRVCQRAGFTPRVRHRLMNCEVVLPLVRRGDGLAMVHPMCIPPADVVLRPLTGSPIFRSIVLCWQRNSVVDEIVAGVAAQLVTAYHARLSLRPAYRRWWLTNQGPLLAEAEAHTPRPKPCVEPEPVP
ncbi:LysR family transcriptional regulator [Streptacidiphilus sp. EB103A]|uniref:LysR family transcriptional regulator n=1 Tax=Streptacidiphilus sp. EB103A TaxID=3156275 RepID=UPI003519334A